MAKPIKVDFTSTEDSGGFYVEPGKYNVKCTAVEQKTGPNGLYLDFTLVVEGRGVSLHNRCTLAPHALFSLKATLGALMNREIPKSVVSIDPDKLVGRVCTVIVKDREYDGKVYSDIAQIMPYEAPVVAGGTPTDDLEEL